MMMRHQQDDADAGLKFSVPLVPLVPQCSGAVEHAKLLISLKKMPFFFKCSFVPYI
jgi:hypothetical protein